MPHSTLHLHRGYCLLFHSEHLHYVLFEREENVGFLFLLFLDDSFRRLLRYVRKLNEAEADVKRMEVVEEVVADLIDKVVLFEDLESGNIVTHTVNGISETSF